MIASPRFDKYDRHGAYHWEQCDPRSPNFNPPLLARYQVVASRIPRCERLLDVGCGDGYLLARASERCRVGVGIEYEPAAVRLGAQALGTSANCRILRGSVYALPFPRATFDVVLMTDVIEHLKAPENALAEAARVLNPGGRLLLTTPQWRPDRRWDPLHEREFRPSELQETLAPYFGRIALRFFWPLRWSKLYATRVGWKAIKWYARLMPNPFLKEARDPEKFGQILAVCELPVSR